MVQGERFSHPAGSELSITAVGLLVRVPGSDGVVLDDELVQLWQWAPGRSEPELAALPLFAERTMLSAELLALRKAGLLLPSLPAERTEPALPPAPLPFVSAVIVTRNGRRHLEECLPSLRRQSYAALEIVVVDNESADGTAEFVRSEYPEARFVSQPGKPNFARVQPGDRGLHRRLRAAGEQRHGARRGLRGGDGGRGGGLAGDRSGRGDAAAVREPPLLERAGHLRAPEPAGVRPGDRQPGRGAVRRHPGAAAGLFRGGAAVAGGDRAGWPFRRRVRVLLRGCGLGLPRPGARLSPGRRPARADLSQIQRQHR